MCRFFRHAFGALALTLAPGLLLGAPFTYVPDQASVNVDVIDVATNAIVATVPMTNAGDGVAALSRAPKAYVTLLDAGRVSLVDTAAKIVGWGIPPGAPTGATAAAANAQASVTFTPPASPGDAPITGYTVTSIPAGGVDVNAGSTTTTHTLTGLVNGTAYTFTVTATNAAGTSPASAPSNSVTPTFNAFTGPTGAGNATVSFSGGGAGCTFAPQGTGANQSAFFIPVSGHAKSPPAGSAPANVTFRYGLLDFVLVGCTPGSTVSFTVIYPAPLAADTSYYKYGPTPADATPHWYTIPASIGGNTATFSIVDGGIGDDDLAANGTIVDQGGPGFPVAAPQAVPTLSEWALAAMAALFALTGFAAAARRRRT